jgi:sugar phosphate isomerase/epimerase
MRLGYNTNGLAHHDALSALRLLAEIGYQSVALTIDHHLLNPFDPRSGQRDTLQQFLNDHNLHSVIETGARFLLDPRNKHEPTLLSNDEKGRQRRIEFLRYCIEVAADLGSDCVSLWSGVQPKDCDDEAAWSRLVDGLTQVTEHAKSRQVRLAFEPEPGMFIDTMQKFAALKERLGLITIDLTLDIGHLHCQGEIPIADHLIRWSGILKNIHIEDMKQGVHEHLMFGDGEIDFLPVFRALRKIGYEEGVHVELSRHSHCGPDAARRAWTFLDRIIQQIEAE